MFLNDYERMTELLETRNPSEPNVEWDVLFLFTVQTLGITVGQAEWAQGFFSRIGSSIKVRKIHFC